MRPPLPGIIAKQTASPSGPTFVHAQSDGVGGILQFDEPEDVVTKKFCAIFEVQWDGNDCDLGGSGVNNPFNIRILPTGNLRINWADEQYDLDAALPNGSFARVLITLDTNQATLSAALKGYKNNTALTPSGTYTQNKQLDLSAETTFNFFASNNGAGIFRGLMKNVAIDFNEHSGAYPDITNQTNRDKTIEGTLLADGSNFFGAAPYYFIGGAVIGDYTTPVNHGTMGGGVYSPTISAV